MEALGFRHISETVLGRSVKCSMTNLLNKGLKRILLFPYSEIQSLTGKRQEVYTILGIIPWLGVK